MKHIFFWMIAIAFVATAVQQLQWHPLTPEELATAKAAAEAAGTAFTEPVAPMDRLTSELLAMASKGVDIALKLIGGMALFLGVMKVAEEGGALRIISKLLRPLLVLLFPDVPPTHPAMGAIVLNLAANALGLGNAATPFGIKAMRELDKLNAEKGTATNAMALFLAINTSAITLLPTGVIVQRQILGSKNPGAIFATTLVATVCSTTAAILAAKLLQRVGRPQAPPLAPDPADVGDDQDAYPLWASLLALAGLVGLIPAAILWGDAIARWVVPSIIAGMLTFGYVRRVDVYATLITGAKEGFNIAVMIIPYLVAILTAVAMFRASGALDTFTGFVGQWTSPYLPGEALPMAFLRPLSASGASGVMVSIMEHHHPDSYIGFLVSTMYGSTETTFYVLAVYFGAVQVQRMRHTLASALTADLTGAIASVVACWFLYGRLFPPELRPPLP